MGHSYAELRRMSVDELVHAYDVPAQHVDLTVAVCRQEIARREMEEHSQRMLALTVDVHQWIRMVTRLTWIIMGLTAVNVILVGLQLWRSFSP
jgi:hypothetical protein